VTIHSATALKVLGQRGERKHDSRAPAPALADALAAVERTANSNSNTTSSSTTTKQKPTTRQRRGRKQKPKQTSSNNGGGGGGGDKARENKQRVAYAAVGACNIQPTN
jgi:hypothetical protein